MLVVTVVVVVELEELQVMVLLVVLVALGLTEVLVAVGQLQLEATVVLGKIIHLLVRRLVIAEEVLVVRGEVKIQMKAQLVLAQDKVTEILTQTEFR